MNDRPPTHEELERRLANAEGALKALRDGQVDTIAGEHGTMVVRLAEAEARADHIKQVLQTIRNVNQLIISEDDPKQLIERACSSLTRTTGYYRASIVLLPGGCEGATVVASSGVNESCNLLDEQFRAGMYTHCMRRALDQNKIIIVKDPTACANCSLSIHYDGHSALSRRLHHEGKTYGILSVSVPSTYAYDQEALSLFEEVAGNLAFALRKIEAAKELSDNQVELKRAQSLAQLGSWSFDLQTGKVIASEEARNIYGVGNKELTIETIQIIPLPQYRDDLDVRLKELIRKGTPYDVEFQIRRPSDGAIHYIHSVAEYDAERGAVLGTIQDITKRKRTEEALRASEKLLAQSQQIAHVGSWVLEVTANNLTWSDETYRIFGLEPQEFTATYEFFLDLVHPKDRLTVNAAYSDSILRKQDGYELEHQIIRKKSGEVRDVYEKCIHERNSEGEIVRSIGIVQDITDRKRAEEALREFNRLLKATFASMMDAIFILDSKAVVMDCNPAATNIFGYSREEMLGRTVDFLHVDPGSLESFRQHLAAEVAEKGVLHLSEFTMKQKDGTIFPTEHSVMPLEDDQGEKIGWVSVVRDITEHIQAEDALKSNYALLQIAGETAKFGGWSVDLEKNICTWSDAVADIHDVPHGYSPPVQEAINFYAPKWREKITQCFSACVKEGSSYDEEMEIITQKGKHVWVRAAGKAVKNDNDEIIKVQGSFQDITEKKQAEEALRESEEKFRALFENGPIGVAFHKMVYDNSGKAIDYRFLDANSSYLELTGVDPRGKCVTEVFPGIENDPFDWIGTFGRVAKTGEEIRFEQYLDLNKRWYDCVGYQVKPEYFVAAFVEITERKQAEAEQKKLQAQLTQAQKMESVGRLAGGIAHDFNNMLGVILGHTEMALEETDPASPLYTDLHSIHQAGERSADLTRQLLAFARKQTIAPKIIDINDTVEGVLNMLRRLIGEDIDLLWQAGRNLQPVKIDPSQIDQLLANLCVNARDAIDGVGKITIETDAKTFDDDYCRDHLGALPGEYVLLEVSDDGCGMDKKTLSQVFEPFFTTKEQGQGTGLGLASVFGMVKQNNGFINVYSEPGQGTTFKIYLPVYAAKSVEVAEKAHDLPAEHGNETILLVEDESAILKMTTTMLERLGYTVVAAATPGEAIRLAHEYQGRIDLLMTDVVMPEMNGRELAGNILSHNPSLKRLFMSGYTANVIAHHGVLDEGVHFIQKPFSKKDLGRKLREVLEG